MTIAFARSRGPERAHKGMGTGLLVITLVVAWVGASLLFGALLVLGPLDRERK